MADVSLLSASDQSDPTLRKLVQVTGWAVTLIGCLVALLLLRDDPVQWNRVVLNLCAGLVGVTALVLAHLRRWLLAAHVLVWGVWVFVSLVAAGNGGVKGPNLLNYPVLIVLSG